MEQTQLDVFVVRRRQPPPAEPETPAKVSLPPPSEVPALQISKKEESSSECLNSVSGVWDTVRPKGFACKESAVKNMRRW